MNKDQSKECDWELLPYGDVELEYALWIDRSEHLKKYNPDHRGYRLCLSNQSDCEERICFGSVEDIDELVARLLNAREWLAKATSWVS